MKTPPKPAAQPHPAELQHLHQLYESGRLVQAEAAALTMLQKYPKSIAIYNLLGLCQQGQGKLGEAASSFRKLLAIDPRVAEIHCNLATILSQLNDPKAAIASYRKALQIKPQLALAQFNLGALLQAQGLLQEAAHHYQQAVAIEPGFFEALGNLGTVLQQRGQLEAAERCYRKALVLRPDARGHFNLGTTLYGQGEHEEAIRSFRSAVKLDPHFADAWNNLGEVLRDRGDMAEAVHCYKTAINAQLDHGRAHYNLAEFFCLNGQLTEAIPYFEASHFADAPERALQCLYKTRQFEAFKAKFERFTANRRHASVLLGTLSTHYAVNFQQENPYRFCKDPMGYVQHIRIEELSAPENPLLDRLLHDIQNLAIAERKQGRLYFGIQSAGNLLQRPEPSFQKLATLICNKVKGYQKCFRGGTDELIRGFPKGISFASSWYLRMKQGGYLTSHMHEEGWISGCVYLQLPPENGRHEGSFEYGLDGDDYPRLHDGFPSQIVDLKIGDLVLFPSSLFHRTLPFHAGLERVCVAFDVKPGPV